MDTLGNAILGLVFLALSACGTFLMYHLWGYPFDHAKLKSTAPRKLMLLHHLIGYAYAAIYIYLMFQMVPRLWYYQIEFPARTVAHLTLGMSIGVILIAKLTIVRFFKHLESILVPFLGTGLFICTFLLVGLSVPFALKELYLHQRAVGGSAFSKENIERVKMLLPRAGFSSEVNLGELATVPALKQGRDVLLSKCVQCHDLRTVLIKPRTPDNWVQTVSRMAERSIIEPISEQEQWQVAAYLIAISPELQKGFQRKRQQEMQGKSLAEAVVSPMMLEVALTKNFDLADTKQTFEATCSQCHKLSNVDNAPPSSAKEASELVGRMVSNGLKATDEELQQIVFYLTKTYAKQD
ncbi:MAG TPA: cytochrome c [Bacteroidota bacterium]|nr:cytochrome c [Bacteroidota bacterium]